MCPRPCYILESDLFSFSSVLDHLITVTVSDKLSMLSFFLNMTACSHYPFTFLLVRNGDSHLFDKVRGYDIKLLRYLSVRYICDLMVENKKVKFGLK